MIELTGNTLTIEELARVARGREQAEISLPARAAIERSRAAVDALLLSGAAVYGLTTGFGKFSEKRIADADTQQLQRNLIVSHACGTGDPLPTEAVRGVLVWASRNWRRRALVAGHFADNPASGRVLEKAGFLYTGEVRPKFSIARGADADTRMMVWLA